MKDMQAGPNARVRVFLLDCASSTSAGADCSTVAIGTITRRPWATTPDTWIGSTAFLGDVDYPVAAGRPVVVTIVFGGAESEDDMWFSYDAGGFTSSLQILGPAPERPGGVASDRFAIQ